MKKFIAAAAATIALAPLGMVASPAQAVTGRYFANCTALNHVWPHGVAKGPKAAQYQVRQGYHKPAYGPKARAVYWRNYKSLDRDKDGTACER